MAEKQLRAAAPAAARPAPAAVALVVAVKNRLLDGNVWIRVGDHAVADHKVVKANPDAFAPLTVKFGKLPAEAAPAPAAAPSATTPPVTASQAGTGRPGGAS